MGYTTKTQLAKYLKRSLTSDEDALFDTMLGAVTKFINDYTGSNFDKVDATTRYYDTEGDCGNIIDIDPVQSVTKVSSLDYDKTVGYDYTVDTEYLLEPLNETIKTQLINRFGHWGRSYQRVAVTGKFSEYDYENDAVPDDIQMAAMRLLGGLFKGDEQTMDDGNVKSETLEGHKKDYLTPADGVQSLAFSDTYVMTVLKSRQQVLIG